MADYESFPVWLRDGTDMSNVDPARLPIGEGLAEGLMAWADDYDRTLDRDDPAASGFVDAATEADFAARGETLARRLAQELGTGWSVAYFDSRVGRDVTIAA